MKVQSKKEVFLEFLRSGVAFLHFDARSDHASVPDTFGNDHHLVLSYGYDMPIPINDLEIDDEGVRATLSFSKVPHETFVPWSTVYMIASEGEPPVIYDEDAPVEMREQIASARARMVPARPARHLKLVN